MSEDIEVFKLGKLSSQKNIDNVGKESDGSNCMDISDYKYSDEIDHMGKNDEETVTEVIEVLKLGKFSSQKNIDNVEK